MRPDASQCALVRRTPPASRCRAFENLAANGDLSETWFGEKQGYWGVHLDALHNLERVALLGVLEFLGGDLFPERVFPGQPVNLG